MDDPQSGESKLNLLRESLLQKEKQILELEKQLASYAARNENLQKYLDLFLNHPAYKVYKSFKKLFRGRGWIDGSSSKHGLSYETFQKLKEPGPEDWNRQKLFSRGWINRPKLAIVTAVFNPSPEIFHETALSVLNQTYENWTWYVVDASSEETAWSYLSDLSRQDERVKASRISTNEGISENLNFALRQVKEDFVTFLDHDDTLAPHALYAVASTILKYPDADFIYSDSDKLEQDGRRSELLFKPDWSPEAMLSINLMSHLSTFRRALLDEVGYLNRKMDGAQDWDFYFRIAESSDRIHHIPQVLYHWRKSAKSTAESTRNKPRIQEAQALAIGNHLRRSGLIEPEVRFDSKHPIHHTHPLCSWKIPNPKKISIVIPSIDHAAVLERCLTSLFQLTDYPEFELILVDTGSKKPETWKLYDRYSADKRFKVIRYEAEFNFGKACNMGARAAEGELLLFLNNDTEILHANWLSLMAQWFERKGVGIVGAKLLYPDKKIQHAGVIVGLGGLAAHVFAGADEHLVSIFGSDDWYRNYSAVTGACMMISREVFDRVNGFDEEFHLNWSDVELCLQARKLGYRIVYTPNVRLIHHESVTHRRLIPRADFQRSTQQWQPILAQGDPYFNSNLSYGIAMPHFLFSENESAYRCNLSLMTTLPRKEMIQLPQDLNDKADSFNLFDADRWKNLKGTEWLTGKGIEIGAHFTPIRGIQPIYVDRFFEFAGTKCLIHVAADANVLPFQTGSLDFVAASHLLEHLPNPILTLVEWYRVVKSGGIIYMVIPDRRFTFDRYRQRTRLPHLLQDFENRTPVSDPTHIDDFILNVDFSTFLPEVPTDEISRVRKEHQITYWDKARDGKEINIHFHVFEKDDVIELMEFMKNFEKSRCKWEIVEVQEKFPSDAGDGFLIVLKVNKN